jgi:hypothetical protein
MVRVLLQSNIGIQVGNFDTFGCSGTVELEVVEQHHNIDDGSDSYTQTHSAEGSVNYQRIIGRTEKQLTFQREFLSVDC